MDEEALQQDRDWMAVREAYEHGPLIITDICKTFGVSKGALEHRCRNEGWTPRSAKAAPNPTILVRRMLRVLDRQVQRLEMMKMDEQSDKNVALLGTMAGTMAKLTDLQKADSGAEPKQKKDMRDLRDKLAKRIDQLKQR